jgi:hypothetical protein
MYAHSVSMRKKVLSTFFLSATHATVSTCQGCRANKAATAALRHTAPVIRLRSRKSISALAIWKPRLTR